MRGVDLMSLTFKCDMFKESPYNAQSIRQLPDAKWSSGYLWIKSGVKVGYESVTSVLQVGYEWVLSGL